VIIIHNKDKIKFIQGNVISSEYTITEYILSIYIHTGPAF